VDKEERKMIRLITIHWEYPVYAVVATAYIPMLSGAVLVFTVLRIRATLRRRQNSESRRHRTPMKAQSAAASGRSIAAGNQRTMKILTCTSVAYFVCWSPYVVTLMAQCFLGPSSFQPAPGVRFAVMWLANSNSAVNVFIYSSTNDQFRHQCVLLASRLCCRRLPRGSSVERSTPCRPRDVSTPPSPAIVSCSL